MLINKISNPSGNLLKSKAISQSTWKVRLHPTNCHTMSTAKLIKHGQGKSTRKKKPYLIMIQIRMENHNTKAQNLMNNPERKKYKAGRWRRFFLQIFLDLSQNRVKLLCLLSQPWRSIPMQHLINRRLHKSKHINSKRSRQGGTIPTKVYIAMVRYSTPSTCVRTKRMNKHFRELRKNNYK